ncbi:MAG: glutamate mutase L [Firmicutes bacterium]|nr:glutamate mutase L [Bacillota bacterium]
MSEAVQSRKRRVMVAAIGDCVHSLGVESFAEWMEDLGLGYVAIKLGPAVPVAEVINKIRESRPEVVGISIRLGDLHVDKLVTEFVEKAWEHGLNPQASGIRYCFGGLRPAANLVRAMTGQPVLEDRFSLPEDRHYDLERVAEEYRDKEKFRDFFALIVDDFVTMEELLDFALGKPPRRAEEEEWSDELLERIRQVRERENRPILRAHIGIAADSVEPTIRDVEEVSEAGALEIVSLGPDQPSQAYLAKFIRGEEDPDKYLKGQGGVPIRSKEDLIRLKQATRRGNFPMIRIYSGTDELLELAKIFEETLHMPFPAVPIFFYNELDGRGPISIRDSFDEHFRVMRWWASLDKPLEINDPHQWQLRNCSDDMYVTDHVVAGVVALKMGIRHYIMQLMFDLPPQISGLMDLAKMQAAYELIEPLTRHYDFHIIKETRGGLSSFPPNLNMAKGHLAVTTWWQMFVDPDIIHVVSYPEAHHEARARDIIESCEIVKQVVKDFYKGQRPNLLEDPRVLARKEELKRGAMYNILHLALMGGYQGPVTVQNFREWAVSPEEAARRLDPEARARNYETMLLSFVDEASYPGGECGMISPDTLDLALQTGLFQAPKITVLDKRYEMVGRCRTKMVDGCCRIDEFDHRKVKDEMERVDLVRARYPWYFDRSISVADEESYISELPETIDESVVRAFRDRVGIHRVEGKRVLVVDFGSTFTKIGTFDTDREDFRLRYVPTTPEDLREGLANGLGVLEECRERGDWEPLARAMAEYDIKLPCSSAKGGLKVVTVGLVREESGEAAELAALTAGAKLVGSYWGRLTEELVDRIYGQDRPEMILLAGGVDYGGEAEIILHNARLLAEGARRATYARYGIPVIYAGNQDVASQVERIFRLNGVDVRVTPNVMPEVNTFRIEAVNEAIRDLFQTVIIRGKGFDVVEEYMSAPFLPTPRAAFLGINLLARGYQDEPGLGNLVALDIGGATTDFYANVGSNPLYSYPGDDPRKKVKRTILKTPNAPLAYRRVEGKFGLAYDAENLLELPHFADGSAAKDLSRKFWQRFPGFRPRPDLAGTAGQVGAPAAGAAGRVGVSAGGVDGRVVAPGGEEVFHRFFSSDRPGALFDVNAYLRYLSAHPHHLPATEEESWLHSHLGREIMAITTRNNVGRVQETDTYFLQYGVNFFNNRCTTLLIGGTIYHKCRDADPWYLEDLRIIASGALYDPAEPHVLRPQGEVLLDASYLVSIVGGLYGRLDPARALRMMKRHLRPLPVEVPVAVREQAGVR